jgi:hypothetical protein
MSASVADFRPDSRSTRVKGEKNSGTHRFSRKKTYLGTHKVNRKKTCLGTHRVNKKKTPYLGTNRVSRKKHM